MPSKRSIPRVPAPGEDRRPFDTEVKATLEAITGRTLEPIAALPATATLADVIAKTNEIIARLQ